MRITTKKTFMLRQLIGAGLLSLSVSAWAQYGVTDGEWRHYAGDAGSTKYSALDQINADNFDQLETAWRWQSLDGGLDLENIDYDVAFGRMQGTPLMVK